MRYEEEKKKFKIATALFALFMSFYLDQKVQE